MEDKKDKVELNKSEATELRYLEVVMAKHSWSKEEEKELKGEDQR